MFVIFLTQIAQISQIFLTLQNTNAEGIAKTLSVVAPAARADKKESESEAAILRIERMFLVAVRPADFADVCRLRRLFFYLTQISQITRIFLNSTKH